MQNQLLDRSYELAYSFLLAVFPLLFFLLALLGILAAEGSRLRTDLFVFVKAAMPPAGYSLLIHTLNEVTHNTFRAKLTFGLLFALLTGSGGVTQLMSALNAAYEVREARSWIRVHLISLGLTAGMSILIILALFLLLAGNAILNYAVSVIGFSSAAYAAAKFLQWSVALGFVVFAFAVIYYFAPDVAQQHWYWITPGSVAGVLIWTLASASLRVYLHFFNSYSRTYGSLGAVIILLLWFYITGLAFLVGGEINATIEHAAAERGHPEAKPVGSKAA